MTLTPSDFTTDLRHWLRSIRRSIPRTVFQSLVSCLVLPRLDYCNSMLAGIPLHLVRRLESVMNAAARLVFSSSKCDQITPHLRQLHWLTISWRIDFKLAVLVYKCFHGLAPSIRHISPMNFIVEQSRSKASVYRFVSQAVCSPRSTLNLFFQSLSFGSGTVFRSTSHSRRHFPSSALA